MKKQLSLCLVFMLILSTFSLPTAEAATIDDSLIFNMDISNYDAASVDNNKGIINNVPDNNTTSILVPGAPAIGTIAGTNTKYLTIRDASGADTNKGIKVLDTTVNSATSLTIETWTRNKSDGTGSDHLLLLTKGSGTHSMQIFNKSATQMSYRPYNSTENKDYSVTSFKNTWSHYVFTRTFTDAGCTWSVYINGTLITSGTVAGKSMLDQTDYYMHIGGGTYSPSVAFKGDIATFKVYSGVMSASEVQEKYENSVVSFMEPISTMNLVSVSPENGSTISTLKGTITLKFDNVADSATLSAISLVDATTGVTIPGGIQSAIKASTKEIVIKYDSIAPNSNYKLIVSSDLKSINNVAYGGTEFLFQSASNVIIDEDFSGNQFVEDQVAPTGYGLTYIYGTSEANPLNNEMNGFVVKNRILESGLNDKYLSIGSDSITFPMCNRAVRVVLPKEVTEGALVAEVEVRPGGINPNNPFGIGASRAALSVYNNTATNGNNLLLSSSGVVESYGFGGHFSTQLGNRNEFGFYRLKMVAQKDESTGNYYIEVFSPNDEAFNGRKDILQSKITALQLAHIYTTSTNQLDDRSDLSAIKIYTAASPEVIYFDNYDYRQKTIEFMLNDDLDVTTLAENGIVVKKGDTEITLGDNPIYDAMNRKLTVSFANSLESDETYTLSFSGVFSQSGVPLNKIFSFVPHSNTIDLKDNIIFTDQNGNSTNILKDVTEITANFTLKNNTGKSQSPKAILVLYEGNEMKNCSIASTNINSGVQAPVSVSLTGITATSSSVVKLFVWYDLENIIPIIDSDIVVPYQLHL